MKALHHVSLRLLFLPDCLCLRLQLALCCFLTFLNDFLTFSYQHRAAQQNLLLLQFISSPFDYVFSHLKCAKSTFSALQVHTFRGPHWCEYCANFMWGLIAQGVKCAGIYICIYMLWVFDAVHPSV